MIDRYVLLAEDNPNDAELTIAALRESKLVSPIVVVGDGADAGEPQPDALGDAGVVILEPGAAQGLFVISCGTQQSQ